MAFRIAFLGFVPPDNDGAPYRYLALECLTSSVKDLYPDIDCQSWIIKKDEIDTKAKAVIAFRPMVVAISMPIGSFNIVKEFRDRLLPSYNDAKMIIGNMTVSIAPQVVLNEFPDAWLIRGEGEIIFPEVIRFLYEGKEGYPFWIEGLCGEGKITGIAKRESCFGGFDTSLWPEIIGNGGNALIEGSRGCVGNCTFCSTKKMHPCGWIAKPIPDILDELHALTAYGVSWVFFVDDDFVGPDWPRAIRLVQSIHENFPDLRFGSSFRAASFLTEQDNFNLGVLVENGLRSMLIGAESFSASQLKRFGKSSVQKNIDAIHNIEKYKEIDIIIGFLIDPLITVEEFRDSIGTLLREGFTSYINDPFRLLDIHMGTEYFKLAQKENLLDSFIQEEIKYLWHFADKRMDEIHCKLEIYQTEFGEKEKRLKSYYRSVSRSAVRKETNLQSDLKLQLDEIKRLKCRYLFELADGDKISAQSTLDLIGKMVEEDY